MADISQYFKGLSKDLTKLNNLSNLAGSAASVLDSIPPKTNNDFLGSKYGKQLNKQIAGNEAISKVANIGFNPALMTATGGISAIVGAGLKAGSFLKKLNTDEYGRSKIGLLPKSIRNKKANENKNLFDRSNSMKEAQDLRAMSSNVYGFQKGGKLSNCGCNKNSDGIDTDIFHSFPSDMMKVVQSFIGTVTDGKYKDSDKEKMKKEANDRGMKLIDYLNQEPNIKITIMKHQNGGLISKDVLTVIMKCGGTLKAKSGIKIKPENEGKFTEFCGGKVTNECITKGKNSSDPVIRKRATFAANARKWN